MNTMHEANRRDGVWQWLVNRTLLGVSRGLLAQDSPDMIDAPVERGHDADARALRACHKVGISEIEALHLVQLDSSLEERAINDAGGAECKDGPQHLGYLSNGYSRRGSSSRRRSSNFSLGIDLGNGRRSSYPDGVTEASRVETFAKLLVWRHGHRESTRLSAILERGFWFVNGGLAQMFVRGPTPLVPAPGAGMTMRRAGMTVTHTSPCRRGPAEASPSRDCPPVPSSVLTRAERTFRRGTGVARVCLARPPVPDRGPVCCPRHESSTVCGLSRRSFCPP